MKYLKTFENINQPDVGDYVICTDPGIEREQNEEFYDFIHNNIGQITKIENEDNPLYYIHYENIPDNLKFRMNTAHYVLDEEPYRRKNITYWAKTKKDLELRLIANKYNL